MSRAMLLSREAVSLIADDLLREQCERTSLVLLWLVEASDVFNRVGPVDVECVACDLSVSVDWVDAALVALERRAFVFWVAERGERVLHLNARRLLAYDVHRREVVVQRQDQLRAAAGVDVVLQ